MRRRAGSAPHPLPPLRWRSREGEGGGGWRVVSCLGILSREGGIFGSWIGRVIFACGFGVSPRQDIFAGLLGGSIWRVKLAHLFNDFKVRENMLLSKGRNRKGWNVLWWICRLRYHYVVSNIVLFALLQVHQNQQIVVLKPWLRGSVNLTANENIHHEEERTSFFCCSARFRWSMHRPGYVQGGQEVGRDYLLLRIHVKRIRSDIQGIKRKIS